METSHADVIGPLNTFCQQTSARNGNWGITPKSKMQLRCTLAASYEDDPGLSLHYLLKRNNCPIDLKNSAFNPIADFLTDFIARVTA
jgi:hypothetical protein